MRRSSLASVTAPLRPRGYRSRREHRDLPVPERTVVVSELAQGCDRPLIENVVRVTSVRQRFADEAVLEVRVDRICAADDHVRKTLAGRTRIAQNSVCRREDLGACGFVWCRRRRKMMKSSARAHRSRARSPRSPGQKLRNSNKESACRKRRRARRADRPSSSAYRWRVRDPPCSCGSSRRRVRSPWRRCWRCRRYCCRRLAEGL